MSTEKFLPCLKYFFNAVCFYIKREKMPVPGAPSPGKPAFRKPSEGSPGRWHRNKIPACQRICASDSGQRLPLMISAGQPGDLRQTNRKEAREFFPPQSLPARGGTSALPAGSYLYTGSQTGYPDEKYGHNYFICFSPEPGYGRKNKTGRISRSSEGKTHPAHARAHTL